MDSSIFLQGFDLEELKEAFRKVIREEVPPMKEEDLLLSRGEAADYLGISPQTLNDYVQSGRLRCRRIGGRGKVYFLLSDIYDALK